MPFKIEDKLGDHAVVQDLSQPDPANKDHVQRPNFGYEQFQPEVGSKLGDFTVVTEDTKGAEAVWVHIDGSPAGTSNLIWLVK